MGEIRWYLQWLFLGLFAICIVMLAIRFSTLAQRVPLAGSSAALVQTAAAHNGAPTAPGRSRLDDASTRDTGMKAPGGADEQPGPAANGESGKGAPPYDAQSWRYRRSAPPTAAVTQGKLNLNSASLEELIALPGIGPKLAQRIVDYRRQHGMFRRVEDLDQVKGIGPSKLAQIKALVTIKAQGG
jgi:competence protein ComEA